MEEKWESISSHLRLAKVEDGERKPARASSSLNAFLRLDFLTSTSSNAVEIDSKVLIAISDSSSVRTISIIFKKIVLTLSAKSRTERETNLFGANGSGYNIYIYIFWAFQFQEYYI